MALREAGADKQTAVLLARDPAAHAALDTLATGLLLKELRRAGAEEQAKALVGRLPPQGQFSLFRAQPGHEALYRFGRETDSSPSPPWGWDDLD